MYSLRRETLILSDERTKRMTESITGIRIIKYFGWEKMVINSVNQIRELESLFIFKNAKYRGLLDVVSKMTP